MTMEHADYEEMRGRAVPIEDLSRAMEGDWRGRNDEPVVMLREAEVVLGVDSSEDRHAIFYGADVLRRIVSRGAFIEARPTRTMVVSLDFDAPDLEVLCAATEVVKGSHCYRGEGGGQL